VGAGSEPRSITAQLERVRRLARDLESLAEGGGRTTVFDLRDVVGIGERLLRPLVSKLGELQVALPAAAMEVRGDRARLAQVVANVLINAAQAIDGRPGGQVAVLLEQRDKCALISVIDNGAGIPAHQLEHVFDPYGGDDRAQQGAGLAEAYDIITQHEGTIAVESEVGMGTRVIVELPLAPVAGTMFYQGVPPTDESRR
jgi:signal transduction histidine kinase